MYSILANTERYFRWVLVVIALYCSSGSAAEIGDTRAEVIARHGPPPIADNSKGIVIYRWDLWKLEIHFIDDVARKLTYTKTDPLLDADIQGILAANGGATAWRSLSKWLWMRSDAASATLDSTDRTLSLQGSRKFSPPSVAQQAVARMIAVPTTAPSPIATVPLPSVSQILNQSPIQGRNTPPLVASEPANTMNSSFLLISLFVAAALAVKLNRYEKRKRNPVYSSRPQFSPIQEGGETVKQPFAPTPESVTWEQFELVIAEIYRRKGYIVEISSGLGADGGIDVTLFHDGTKTLVQCKQRRTESVGVKPVRELFGVLISEGAARGVMVTTSEYTRDAREFADGKLIDLLTRSSILELVKSVERPGENLWDIDPWIAEFVAGARIVDPDCPRCRKPMVLRQPANGTPFWGCPGYPRCHGKRDARMDLVKVRSH